jgi:hypothetical protein
MAVTRKNQPSGPDSVPRGQILSAGSSLFHCANPSSPAPHSVALRGGVLRRRCRDRCKHCSPDKRRPGHVAQPAQNRVVQASHHGPAGVHDQNEGPRSALILCVGLDANHRVPCRIPRVAQAVAYALKQWPALCRGPRTGGVRSARTCRAVGSGIKRSSGTTGCLAASGYRLVYRRTLVG